MSLNLMTPKEVAAKYKVSVSTVYSVCESGSLTCYRPSARPGRRGKILIDEADVLAWLDDCKHEAGVVEDDGPLKYL